VESFFLGGSEKDLAVSYGDPLITSEKGQIKLIMDAKSGKKEAQNYLFLQFQDIITRYFKQVRAALYEIRKIEFNEWLSIAYESLTSPEVGPKGGKMGAVYAFDESRANAKSLSNLAKNYESYLQNRIKRMEEEEFERPDLRRGVGKGIDPTETKDQFHARQKAANKNAVSYNAKVASDEGTHEIVDNLGKHNSLIAPDKSDNPADQDFDTDSFLKKFKKAASSPELSKEFSNGLKLRNAVFYRLEGLLSSDHNRSVKDIEEMFPQEARPQVKKICNNIMDVFARLGIPADEFRAGLEDAETRSDLLQMLEEARRFTNIYLSSLRESGGITRKKAIQTIVSKESVDKSLAEKALDNVSGKQESYTKEEIKQARKIAHEL
jgi:hypothetical protein